MNIKTCRDCGKEFDLEAKRTMVKAGFVDQCAQCSVRSKDNNIRYLGKPGLTNKDSSIEIFRENLSWVKAVIKGENSRGFTANLNFGSIVTASEKTDELV